MKHKVFVFDFDGTLVQSNEIKRNAFYDSSVDFLQHKDAVDEVLAAIPERSRFEIIERIYDLIATRTGSARSQAAIDAAVNSYSTLVREGVSSCPELPGATEVLKELKKHGRTIFVSSNTPVGPLAELLQRRGWSALIAGHFGFPSQKSETIRELMKEHGLQPKDIIVIGDGRSDEVSAAENGCDFFRIESHNSLQELLKVIKTAMYV